MDHRFDFPSESRRHVYVAYLKRTLRGFDPMVDTGSVPFDSNPVLRLRCAYDLIGNGRKGLLVITQAMHTCIF